jgi:hypothetical protein
VQRAHTAQYDVVGRRCRACQDEGQSGCGKSAHDAPNQNQLLPISILSRSWANPTSVADRIVYRSLSAVILPHGSELLNLGIWSIP